jgi:hypothetical protein
MRSPCPNTPGLASLLSYGHYLCYSVVLCMLSHLAPASQSLPQPPLRMPYAAS